MALGVPRTIPGYAAQLVGNLGGFVAAGGAPAWETAAEVPWKTAMRLRDAVEQRLGPLVGRATEAALRNTVPGGIFGAHESTLTQLEQAGRVHPGRLAVDALRSAGTAGVVAGGLHAAGHVTGVPARGVGLWVRRAAPAGLATPGIEAEMPHLSDPDLAGREKLRWLSSEEVVARTRELQPALDAFGQSVARSVRGARWFGRAKSLQSLLGKVARNRARGNLDYTQADLNDHIRGTVMVRDWEDAPRVIETLRAAGFRRRGSVTKPMNEWGFMGPKGERLVGELGGEIQIWTPSGWKLKQWSDRVYQKWRGVDLRKLPREERLRYEADRAESVRRWRIHWDSVHPEVRRRISDSLSGRASKSSSP